MRIDRYTALLLFYLGLIALCLFGPLCCARASGDWAVIRITSHGCSGTVIYADQTRSLVLSCAHMFLAPPRYSGEPDRIDPQALAKSFTFDAPHPFPTGDPRPGIRLLKYDVATDLCLIQINTRLPYVCPVASGPCPGPAASAGYDFMGWPAVVRPATVWKVDGWRQYTRERPRGGRSGGPLLACGGTCVIGTCTGYVGPPNNLEVVPGGYGIYSSQAALTRFLAGCLPVAPTVPIVVPVPVPVAVVPVPRPLTADELIAGGRPVQPWQLPDPRFRGPPPGAPRVSDRVTPYPQPTMPYAQPMMPYAPACPPGGS